MNASHSRKAELRERALAARAALGPSARRRAAAVIRRELAGLPAVTSAEGLLAYAAFGQEVDLDPLLAERLRAGTVVYLPVVAGAELECAPVGDLDELARGYRGVREPPMGARGPADPRGIDVALVPGVAFDRRGGRLGYGGGHFDRLLARLRRDAVVVGVAYAAQVVDEVPIEDHDHQVDMVITEEGNLRVAG